MTLRKRLLGLHRRYKRLLQVGADVLLIWLAVWLAFILRLGSEDQVRPFGAHAWLFIAAPLMAIPLFIRMGLYRAVLRYLDNDGLLIIFKAVSLAALLLVLAVYGHEGVPASVAFNYWWVSLLLVGGLRLLMRQYFIGDWGRWHYARQSLPLGAGEGGLTRVAIYGAGSTGRQLAEALRRGRSMCPVAFVDDDESLAGCTIAGLKVYKARHVQRMIDETAASELLLAIPSASRTRRREVLAALEDYPLHVRSVPSLMDLARGRVRVEDIQEVDIADLLGRDEVEPRIELFECCIRGKVVMVTGAGGSIGSELCRQIVTQAPAVLILFECSEYNLYSIHRELEAGVSSGVELIPILGSVCNSVRMLDVMRCWKVDTLYHAAAYKHVPIVEQNIVEGVLNNVFGTLNAAQAALRSGVHNFVLISTDKAVRPTNVMGCTKRLAELLLQGLSRESMPLLHGFSYACSNRTRFCMVRFGNVLGSSGSVIPLFREQIRRGGPVTVTHPEITRYFMTIPEAAQLVIQAGAMGVGGDVFVLDMGEPVRIVELAEKMIRLSGLSLCGPQNPCGDIAIEYSGLRSGEKLYEELLIGDSASATQHPMIYRADEKHISWSEMRVLLDTLQVAVADEDCARIRVLLKQAVPEYRPEGGIVDLVYCQRERDLRDAMGR